MNTIFGHSAAMKRPDHRFDHRFDFAGTPGLMCPMINALKSVIRCTV